MLDTVADASVVAALFFEEPRAPEAYLLLSDAKLYEPALLGYELASIARAKVFRYPGQRADLMRALQIALAVDITWVTVNHGAVVALALGTRLSTYDASYLYLARTLGIPLVTFDEQLARVSRS